MILNALVLFILFGFLFSNKKNTKIYVFFCVIFLVLIAGLRHESVGVDTHTYVWKYIDAKYMDYSEIWSNKEALYYSFQTFLSKQSFSPTFFLCAAALLFYPIVGIFIYKYSRIPAMSILLFLSMGYFYFSMTGMRQTLGLGFLLLSLIFILKKQYIKGIIYISIASLFHITSLIYLIVIPISFISQSKLKTYFVILISTMIVIVFFAGFLLFYFANLIWDDGRYTEINPQGGFTTLLLLIAIAIFCYKCLKKEFFAQNQNNSDFQLLKIMLVGIPLQTLTIYAADAFRLAMLFHITSIIVLPNAVASIRDRNLKSICIFLIIILLLIEYYMFTSNGAGIQPYHFFWEKV